MRKLISKSILNSYNLLRNPQHEVAVLIPIYKSALTDNEIISLDRCLNQLSKYNIVIIAPDYLQLDKIQPLVPYKYSVARFCNSHFNSVQGYNNLLLQQQFYWRFVDYKYILICQLDTFIFDDTLSYWCNLTYDYIGAPWIACEWVNDIEWKEYFANYFKNGIARYFTHQVNMVGNGGLSLRNVRSCLIALTLLQNKANKWVRNEDTFWSFEVPRYLPFFKIPDVKTACKFSIETEPQECLKMNGGLLPFGCHAWEKYDLDYWRNVFKRYGYDV